MWAVNGNIQQSYSVNEFPTSVVETSRFVIDFVVHSNKPLSLVPQYFGRC